MNKVIAVLATGLTALALSWIPVAHAHAATAPTLQIVTGAAALPGMACPTSTICYAVGVNSGSTGVLVPVANGVPDTAQVVPGTDGLENIACSDASTCIAVGLSTGPSATAVIVPVDDGVAGAPEPVIGADLGLFDVACPTVTTCIAVGSNASSQGVVVPITNGAPGTAQIVANTSSLTSLGCPSATECEAAGADNASPAGDVVPIVDGTAGTAVPVPGASGFFDIACPTATQCEVAGFNGSPQGVIAAVTNGVPGTPQVVSGAAILFGIACPSAFLCETVGLNDSGTGVAVSLSDGVPGTVQTVAGAKFVRLSCPDVCEVTGVNSAQQAVIGTLSPVFTLPYPAILDYPLQGATGVDTTQPFRLGDVPGAQGYLLVVGSNFDGTNLFNSGFLSATTSSIPMPAFPPGVRLYATLFTESNGTWATYTTSSFSAAPGVAVFTNPLNGQSVGNRQPTFKWSTVAGSQGTILVVGTTPYGSDLLNSGVLPPKQSSYQGPVLPTGKALYANLLTKVNGTWTRYQRIAFTVS